MPEPKWDLSSIIDNKQQAEIQKLGSRKKNENRMGGFLCRIGWHRKTVWNQVGAIQMCNVRPDGEQVPWEFEFKMRCCTQCGVPDVKIVRA